MKLLTIFVLISILCFVRGEQRIVGGETITIDEAAYNAVLLKNVNGFYNHVCGGAIIRLDRVLTAAQCTDTTFASQWKIRGATSYHNSAGQVVDVSKIVQHPEYTIVFNNDISIMFLETSFIAGNDLRVIPLPTQGQIILDNLPAFITGWGAMSENGTSLQQLQKATIPTLNQDVCKEVYNGIMDVTDNMLCAGYTGANNQAPCFRDDGAPMTIHTVLQGLFSWSVGCGRNGFPSVYTRVAQFVDWINNNID